MTQRELAELVGVETRTLQYWERGTVDIKKANAFMILSILKDHGIEADREHR